MIEYYDMELNRLVAEPAYEPHIRVDRKNCLIEIGQFAGAGSANKEISIRYAMDLAVLHRDREASLERAVEGGKLGQFSKYPSIAAVTFWTIG